jgi:hypothetical protein
MKAYGGDDVYIHIFLTSALVAVEWLASIPCCSTPGESLRYPLDRNLGGPRAGPDHVEKREFLTLPKLKLWPLSRLARNQTLKFCINFFPHLFVVSLISHPGAKTLNNNEHIIVCLRQFSFLCHHTCLKDENGLRSLLILSRSFGLLSSFRNSKGMRTDFSTGHVYHSVINFQHSTEQEIDYLGRKLSISKRP